MAATFFEGPEKKAEIVVRDCPDLRSFGDEWNAVVKAAQANVLATIRNEHCDAYLLSESSLFVFEDHFTMITCGRTKLVEGINRSLDFLEKNQVALLIYERKNEHFPELQPTSFEEDAGRLSSVFPGRALQFGREHSHHVNLYAYEASGGFTPEPGDRTLEILMHDIDPRVAARFDPCRLPAAGTFAEGLGLANLLPEFSVDEHAFTPTGYSMNALRGPHYYTIHVTPEGNHSYISFETNLVQDQRQLDSLLDGIVDVFKPGAYDTLLFDPAGELMPKTHGAYTQRDTVAGQVAGYHVRYAEAFQPLNTPRNASAIVF